MTLLLTLSYIHWALLLLCTVLLVQIIQLWYCHRFPYAWDVLQKHKGAEMQTEIHTRTSENNPKRDLRPFEVVEKVNRKIHFWAKAHTELGNSLLRRGNTLFIKFGTSVHRARRAGQEVKLNSTQASEIEHFITVLCKEFALKLQEVHKSSTFLSYQLILPSKSSTVDNQKEHTIATRSI